MTLTANEVITLAEEYGDASAEAASAVYDSTERTRAQQRSAELWDQLCTAIPALAGTAVPVPVPTEVDAVVQLVDADRITLTVADPKSTTLVMGMGRDEPDHFTPLRHTVVMTNTRAKGLSEALARAATEDIVRRELVRDGHPAAAIGPAPTIGHIPGEDS